MKKIYILIFLFGCSIIYGQSSIGGVVTYYFNSYQGDKPDLGAKVFVIDTTKTSTFKYDIWRKYYSGRVYRDSKEISQILLDTYLSSCKMYEGRKKYKEIYADYKSKADKQQVDVNKAIELCIKNNVDTDEKWEAIDTESSNMLGKMILVGEPDGNVDSNGNYSVQVKPGTYYIMLVSKGRTSSTQTELFGKIAIKKIILGENEKKNFSNNFN